MRCFTFALLFVCFCSQATFAQTPHFGDIWVGVSSSNQLKTRPTYECELFLDVSTGNYPGWLSTGSENTGFDHILEDDPNNDMYVMQGSHNIYLELISMKNYLNGQAMTGFYVAQTTAPQVHIAEPGDSLHVGDQFLHRHFNWFLNNDASHFLWGDHAVDPDWFGRVEATFKLTDTGSYADSDPFTIVFTNDAYMIADINQDQTINMEDFADLESQWPQSGCVLPDRCQRADINQDGQVGPEDLFWLAHNWLKNDPDCSL